MGDFIPTLGSKNKKNADQLVEVVNYEEPKWGKSEKPMKKETNDNGGGDQDSVQSAKKRQESEMRKFKHDIMKFSMTGFEKSKARKAKVALAVSLGAEPPKNKKKHYKKLLRQKKQEKLRETASKELPSGFTSTQLDKFKSNIKKNKKVKKTKGILGVYGKVTKNQ
ncbi:uncharacterized protein LOC106638728 [Copidosoma floridanum]|uniref:uncharacterized protein LOC106638728 n=1 Tax=Copidosoma floridanum TaxID=29053 RepID=UPI0006C94648|nr:uncharacterized protein LOC106638728 [Copidosoma floridanum]